MHIPDIIKISGYIQNYHWGKKGSASLISKYINNPSAEENYSEIWYGAHKSAPCALSGISHADVDDLYKFIRLNPLEILGKKIAEKYSNDLPFLLKVLSIEKPLSIQLHPDKKNAAALHAVDPKNYPDANHKPEIAIALSETHLIYGFRSPDQIKQLLRENEEYKLILSQDIINQLEKFAARGDEQSYLKTLYPAVLNAAENQYKEASSKYIQKLLSANQHTPHEKLALQTAKEYGERDLAILTVPLMNYKIMQPSEAIFIEPNMLHAYISGDLLECMANSDNVIRAGMTPKHKDIPHLLQVLKYTCKEPNIITPQKSNNFQDSFLYPAACEEFIIEVHKNNGSLTIENNDNVSSLVFCLEGRAELVTDRENAEMRPGSACFIPAHVKKFTLKKQQAFLVRVTSR